MFKNFFRGWPPLGVHREHQEYQFFCCGRHVGPFSARHPRIPGQDPIEYLLIGISVEREHARNQDIKNDPQTPNVGGFSVMEVSLFWEP